MDRFFITKYLFLKSLIIFRAELNTFYRIYKKYVIQYLHGFGTPIEILKGN